MHLCVRPLKDTATCGAHLCSSTIWVVLGRRKALPRLLSRDIQLLCRWHSSPSPGLVRECRGLASEDRGREALGHVPGQRLLCSHWDRVLGSRNAGLGAPSGQLSQDWRHTSSSNVTRKKTRQGSRVAVLRPGQLGLSVRRLPC